jgi:hypothetical protein
MREQPPLSELTFWRSRRRALLALVSWARGDLATPNSSSDIRLAGRATKRMETRQDDRMMVSLLLRRPETDPALPGHLLRYRDGLCAFQGASEPSRLAEARKAFVTELANTLGREE